MGFFLDWFNSIDSYTSPEKMKLLDIPEVAKLESMFDSKELWDCLLNVRDGNCVGCCRSCNNNLVKNDVEQQKESVHVKKRSKKKKKK